MGFDKEELKEYNFLSPQNGFNVSKKYILDLVSREIIDKSKNNRLPYDIDSKILVYEDRQKTWFFDVAESLKSNNEAGFVILMISIAYLESSQKYIEGKKGKSGEYIRKALARVFGSSLGKDEEKMFVDGVRNGLFHDGITKKGIFLNASQNNIFERYGESMVVNPHEFFKIAKTEFLGYIKNLKSPANQELRNKFEQMWDLQKGI